LRVKWSAVREATGSTGRSSASKVIWSEVIGIITRVLAWVVRRFEPWTTSDWSSSGTR
jgi:hypothetical protein